MLKYSKKLSISNSLPNNSSILLPSGKYTHLKLLKPGDKVLNNNGKKITVKEVRYAGRKKMIDITTEAWHCAFKISEDQTFKSENGSLLLPSSSHFQWEYKRDHSIKYSYHTGYTVGFLLASSLVSGKNIVSLVKVTTTLNKIKELNNCLAQALSIKDIRLEEGSHLVEYIIDKESLQHIILTALETKAIPDPLLNPFSKQYMKGLSKGLEFAIVNTETVYDKKIRTNSVNLLCDWLNITCPGANTDDHEKRVLYYSTPSEKDFAWDLILDDGEDTFIANNMVCVSANPS